MAQPQARGDIVKWNSAAGLWQAEIVPTRLGEPVRTVTVPNGSIVVFDNGHLLDCLVVFKPKFIKVPVPIATDVQLLCDGELGLRLATITSVIALNSLAAFWMQLSFKAEIQQGQVAVCCIHKPDGVGTDYGTYHGPLLEQIDCIVRDEAVFGPRFTPPPPPMLGGAAPRPQLPPPPQPVPAPVGTSDLPPVELPEEPPAEPPKPDPLAKYRPIKKPPGY
jgi:hypothetical protein